MLIEKKCKPPQWKDISNGIKAWEVASNVKNNAVWTVSLDVRHTDGGIALAKFNFDNGLWEPDTAQPEGAINS